VAGLAMIIAPAFLATLSRPPPTYLVGAKPFSEQYILAALIEQRLNANGLSAGERSGLGSAVILDALAAGDIDAYVDYSGTLWTNVLNRKDSPPRAEMLTELTRELKRRYGVTVVGPLGFENAYALAMTQTRADALHIRSIADLATVAPKLIMGADVEFFSRPEWSKLDAAYGLNFKAKKSFQPTFMYHALESGDVDVISAFSSDGRIAADHLVVLTDPKNAIPPYDAVILVAPKRANDQRLLNALRPLVNSITVEQMRTANYAVDGKGETAAQAAQSLARH
jgi:osmoprotectant transport system permease protein